MAPASTALCLTLLGLAAAGGPLRSFHEAAGYGAPKPNKGYVPTYRKPGGYGGGYGGRQSRSGYGTPKPITGYGAPKVETLLYKAPDDKYVVPKFSKGYGVPKVTKGYDAPKVQSGYGAPKLSDVYEAPKLTTTDFKALNGGNDFSSGSDFSDFSDFSSGKDFSSGSDFSDFSSGKDFSFGSGFSGFTSGKDFSSGSDFSGFSSGKDFSSGSDFSSSSGFSDLSSGKDFSDFSSGKDFSSPAAKFGITTGGFVPSVSFGKVSKTLSTPLGRERATKSGGLYVSWENPRHSGGQYTWDQAAGECRQLGLRLVSLTSPQKEQEINRRLPRGGRKVEFYWTSGQRLSEGGQFVWNDGARTPVCNRGQGCYENWGPTGGAGFPQPDNREGRENCLAVLNEFYPGEGIVWHDIGCHHRKHFVCE